MEKIDLKQNKSSIGRQQQAKDKGQCQEDMKHNCLRD